jgi:hypothetical protein
MIVTLAFLRRGVGALITKALVAINIIYIAKHSLSTHGNTQTSTNKKI